jgi:hypothetical protein
MNDLHDTGDDSVHDDPALRAAEHGFASQTVLMLALGALLVTAWRSVSRAHGRRHDRTLPLPERLQTWEGEGGRPDPQTTPRSAAQAAAEPTIDSPV